MILVKTIDLLSAIAGIALLARAYVLPSWNVAFIGLGVIVLGQAIVLSARIRHGYRGSMLMVLLDVVDFWPFL